MHLHSLIERDREEHHQQRQRLLEERRAISAIFGTDVEAFAPPPPIRYLLDIRVVDSFRDRAYRILDAVFLCVEKLGGIVAVDTSRKSMVVELLGEPIRIRMLGLQDGLKLAIKETVSPRKVWRDTPHRRLEDQLGSFVIGLFTGVHLLQAARQEREQKARQQRMSDQLRQQNQQRKHDEIAKFEALEQAAADWHRARVIEEYIAALERHVDDMDDHVERRRLRQQIEWAQGKVAWLDPLIARVDPILGVRCEEAGPSKG